MTQKLSKLKQSVLLIKTKLDNDITNQLEQKKKTIKNLNQMIKESNLTISKLENKIKKKMNIKMI